MPPASSMPEARPPAHSQSHRQPLFEHRRSMSASQRGNQDIARCRRDDKSNFLGVETDTVEFLGVETDALKIEAQFFAGKRGKRQ